LLVVDDEPFVGRIVRAQFEHGPYRVSTATSGEEGLKFLRANQDVDVVLLDVNMPGLSGLDVLEAARSDPTLTRATFVMLTGSGQDATAVRAMQLGAAAFVTKPFSPKKLYRQVAEMLGETTEADLGGEG
jgi:CheY-like chemotaxis protein